MTEPKITSEAYHDTDDRGAWEVVKIFVGDDFYINVACRAAPGARQAAKAIAEELKLALMQTLKAHHEQNRKQ